MLEPFAQALVHLGMVQQREVVGGADVVAVLGLEWDSPGAAAPGGAGRQHEDVAKQAPEGMMRAAGDRGGDEEVRGSRQEWHLLARRRA